MELNNPIATHTTTARLASGQLSSSSSSLFGIQLNLWKIRFRALTSEKVEKNMLNWVSVRQAGRFDTGIFLNGRNKMKKFREIF